MIQVEESLNDAVTSYIISEMFLVDGNWRHLTKKYEDGKVEYYCDGKYEATVSE